MDAAIRGLALVLGYSLGSAAEALWGRGNVDKLLFTAEIGVGVGEVEAV